MKLSNLDLESFLNYKKIKKVRHLITDKQINQIKNLNKVYNKRTIKNRLDSIVQFIICGVDRNWLSRLKIIQDKLKTDVISEYSCKIRYGDKWKEKQDEIKQKTTQTLEKYISIHGKRKGIEIWEDLKKRRRSYSREIMIQRYGEEEGTKKWEETLAKKVKTMSERKKIKPYRNGRTLPEYQDRYGEEEGYILWEKRNKQQSKRFSIDYYIETYGSKLGLIEWDKYCNSMKKTNLQDFIYRYGENLGSIKYNEYINKLIKNLNSKLNYSKSSQELFFKIVENMKCKKDSYFAENNGEAIFYPTKDENIYGLVKMIQVDFKLGKKIIEFDGDYWHSKEEQINRDIIRDEFLTKRGYKIKRVKESNYLENKELIVKDCVNFLKEN